MRSALSEHASLPCNFFFTWNSQHSCASDSKRSRFYCVNEANLSGVPFLEWLERLEWRKRPSRLERIEASQYWFVCKANVPRSYVDSDDCAQTRVSDTMLPFCGRLVFLVFRSFLILCLCSVPGTVEALCAGCQRRSVFTAAFNRDLEA